MPSAASKALDEPRGRSVPLAHAAGLILALVLGFGLPVILPQRLFDGAKARFVRAGSWAVSTLAGVLLAGGLASPSPCPALHARDAQPATASPPIFALLC